MDKKLFKFTFALVNKSTYGKTMELSFAEDSYEKAIAKLPSLVHPSFEAHLSAVEPTV